MTSPDQNALLADRRPATGPVLIGKLRLPAKMRNLELALLIIVCIINAGAIALVQLGALDHIDLTLVYLGAGLSALVLAVHVVLRFVAPQADPFVVPIATLLNGLGIAEIYRIDLHFDDTGWQSAAVRQIVWTAIAIVCAFVVILMLRNHRSLQRYTYIFGLGSIVLLLLPMLPVIGVEINGARIWAGVGSFTFQPGEIAKITLAIFFAGYLVQYRDSLSYAGRRFLGVPLPRLRDLGPLIVVWAISMAVIVFQHDLGTGLLYFGLFLVMLYVATGRASWVFLGLALFALGAFAAASSLNYVSDRVHHWLAPFDPDVYGAAGGSYQLVQGLFGLAHGGLVGTGLGQGRPYLTPVSQSDFIVASLGEELGLVGLFAILVLYLLFVARAFRVGFAGQDDFGKLLAVGLGFSIALQCFIVIGGITRIIPLTGLTTPFLAAGGSSLVANWIIVAILLRLSDSVRNQPRMVV